MTLRCLIRQFLKQPSTRAFLIEFLKGLEAAVPPPENCHHAITFARYGEWDALALQVNIGGKFRCFFINDEDIDRGPESTIAAVVEILNRPNDGNTNVVIGTGPYPA